MEFGSFKELAWRGVLAETRSIGDGGKAPCWMCCDCPFPWHWVYSIIVALCCKMICALLLLCGRTRGQFFGLKLKLPLFGSKDDVKRSSGLVQSPKSETLLVALPNSLRHIWRCKWDWTTGLIARPYVYAGLVFFRVFCLFFVSREGWSAAIENCLL